MWTLRIMSIFLNSIPTARNLGCGKHTFQRGVSPVKNMKVFLSYVLVALLASALTLTLNQNSMASLSREESKLDQLSRLIQERFIGEADVKAMEDAAADAMVNALGDRWSYYLSAEEYAAYKDRVTNSYVGVGITINLREDGTGLNIVEVTKGGPAEEAGLLAGDILIKADGNALAGLDVNTAGDYVRGEAGTTVDLTVLRGDEEKTFTVERRIIQTPPASWTMLEGKVGLVTIENFHDGCAEFARAGVEELMAQGAVALLFDVRNNPGGYVHELVKLLDFLLPEGDLFRSVDYLGKETVEKSDKNFVDLPMAVLVNGESYSAAEFFAAAIREYEAGFVAGTQTCGKGYFQTAIQLKDGSAVGLSVGKYFTPKGVSLAEAGGLIPDVVTEVDEETFLDIYAGALDPSADPQIQAALEKLLEK